MKTAQRILIFNKKSETEQRVETKQREWVECIAFIGNAESHRIPSDEILYIEQVGNKLHIQQTVGSVWVPGRMSAISKELGEPFFPSHSYLMVNISLIESMSNRQMHFLDSRVAITVGRDCFRKTRKAFNEYIALTSKIL